MLRDCFLIFAFIICFARLSNLAPIDNNDSSENSNINSDHENAALPEQINIEEISSKIEEKKVNDNELLFDSNFLEMVDNFKKDKKSENEPQSNKNNEKIKKLGFSRKLSFGNPTQSYDQTQQQQQQDPALLQQQKLQLAQQMLNRKKNDYFQSSAYNNNPKRVNNTLREQRMKLLNDEGFLQSRQKLGQFLASKTANDQTSLIGPGAPLASPVMPMTDQSAMIPSNPIMMMQQQKFLLEQQQKQQQQQLQQQEMLMSMANGFNPLYGANMLDKNKFRQYYNTYMNINQEKIKAPGANVFKQNKKKLNNYEETDFDEDDEEDSVETTTTQRPKKSKNQEKPNQLKTRFQLIQDKKSGEGILMNSAILDNSSKPVIHDNLPKCINDNDQVSQNNSTTTKTATTKVAITPAISVIEKNADIHNDDNDNDDEDDNSDDDHYHDYNSEERYTLLKNDQLKEKNREKIKKLGAKNILPTLIDNTDKQTDSIQTNLNVNQENKKNDEGHDTFEMIDDDSTHDSFHPIETNSNENQEQLKQLSSNRNINNNQELKSTEDNEHSELDQESNMEQAKIKSLVIDIKLKDDSKQATQNKEYAGKLAARSSSNQDIAETIENDLNNHMEINDDDDTKEDNSLYDRFIRVKDDSEPARKNKEYAEKLAARAASNQDIDETIENDHNDHMETNDEDDDEIYEEKNVYDRHRQAIENYHRLQRRNSLGALNHQVRLLAGLRYSPGYLQSLRTRMPHYNLYESNARFENEDDDEQEAHDDYDDDDDQEYYF